MTTSLAEMLNNIERFLSDHDKEDILLWNKIHQLKENELPNKLPSNCIVLVGNNVYDIIKVHFKSFDYLDKIKKTNLIDPNKIAFVKDIDFDIEYNRRITYTPRNN